MLWESTDGAQGSIPGETSVTSTRRFEGLFDFREKRGLETGEGRKEDARGRTKYGARPANDSIGRGITVLSTKPQSLSCELDTRENDLSSFRERNGHPNSPTLSHTQRLSDKAGI